MNHVTYLIYDSVSVEIIGLTILTLAVSLVLVVKPQVSRILARRSEQRFSRLFS